MRLILMFLLSPILCVWAMARPFAGLLILVTMYYFRPPVWFAPSWFRPQLWITIAVGIGWIAHARGTIKFPLLMKMAFLVVVLTAINAFFAEDDRNTSFGALQIVIKLVTVMLFTINLVDTKERMNQFLWANVLAMLWNMKTIMVSGLSGGGVSEERVDVGIGQGGGANYIAMILAMTLPFLYMKILNGKMWERITSIFLAGLYVVGIVLTGSRGGFLSLAAVVMYMLFRSNRRIIGTVIMACLVVLFIALVPTQSVERFKQGVAQEGQRDTSAESRIKLWQAAITMFGEHPWMGIGIDNYQRISPRYVGVFAGKGVIKYEPGQKRQGFVTHSTWFQTLAEGGLMISIPFFLMFPVGWIQLLRVRRARVPKPIKKTLSEQAVILEGIFVGFIVSSTFGSHFKIDFMWWYFGAIAALSLIVKQEEQTYAAAVRMPQMQVPRRRRSVEAIT